MSQGNATVYYVAGTTGWGETFSGRPAALWDPSGLTVTFDAAGGVCETGSTWVPVGSTYGVLPLPTRENYRFAGWWTEPDGNGRQVTDNSPVISLPDHTLYAFWSNSYLCPPGEDDTLTMAGSCDGHFYTSSTFDGKPTKAVRGTLSVKITKVTGTLTAKAVLQTGSLSFSAKTWTQIWPDGTFCAIMRTRSNETLEMYIRQNRIWGALFGGKLGPEFLSLDGARNRFDNTRDAEAQALLNTFKGYYTVSLPIYDALSAPRARSPLK